jgi:pilus assembly protein Flp/PilA
MNELRTRLRRWLNNARGASLTEYIILIGVVALLAIAAFETFGSSVQAKIRQEAGKVNTIKN